MPLPLEQSYYDENGWTIFLSYLDSLAVKEVEYLVYDFNGIVAAVGGGLGLFLGFSVFSVATKGMQIFAKNDIKQSPSP